MSTTTIIAKVNYIKEIEAMIDELKAEADSIKDDIKAEMTARGTDELEAGNYIVRYQNITSNKFDSSLFKREHAELFKAYLKQSISRRFTITA